MKSEIPGLNIIWEINLAPKPIQTEEPLDQKMGRICSTLLTQCYRNQVNIKELEKSKKSIQKEIQHMQSVIEKFRSIIDKFKTEEPPDLT